MKKTLTAIALFAALAAGATTVNANPHVRDNEGYQNYAYYFGANCAARPVMPLAMAIAAPTCGNPCGECAPKMAPIEYEQVCTTCDPCGGSGFNIFNPMTYLG